jgi:hypothetical protein
MDGSRSEHGQADLAMERRPLLVDELPWLTAGKGTPRARRAKRVWCARRWRPLALPPSAVAWLRGTGAPGAAAPVLASSTAFQLKVTETRRHAGTDDTRRHEPLLTVVGDTVGHELGGRSPALNCVAVKVMTWTLEVT